MIRFAPLLLLALGACAASTAPTLPTKQVIELTEQETRGYTFARGNCSGCHAITANAASPNPEAPRSRKSLTPRG